MGGNRENFIRLAESRTNRVLKDLALIGNLANRSNYSYSEADVRKIFHAINARVRQVELRFETQCRREAEQPFHL